MTDSSLILVQASGLDSEVSITLHHPGEAFVILKTVQTLSYRSQQPSLLQDSAIKYRKPILSCYDLLSLSNSVVRGRFL